MNEAERSLLRELLKRHAGMLGRSAAYAALFGLTTAGVAKIFHPHVSLAASASILIAGTFFSWLTYLLQPEGSGMYKWTFPTAIPFVGTLVWGLTGCAVGYAACFVLLHVADARRFMFLTEATLATGGQLPLPNVYSFRRDVLLRPALGYLTAGLCVGYLLKTSAGVTWTEQGNGMFARLVTAVHETASDGAPVFDIGFFCLVWGVVTQLCSSLVDLATTPWRALRRSGPRRSV